MGILFTSVLAVFGFPWLALFMWGLYWLLAIAMAVLAVRGEKKSGYQFLLPVLFFFLHISYGIGTCVGLLKMPFWRGKHKGCPSVQRVKEQMKNGRNIA